MSNLNEETLADTLFLLLRKNDQSTRDLAKQILEIHEKALRVAAPQPWDARGAIRLRCRTSILA